MSMKKIIGRVPAGMLAVSMVVLIGGGALTSCAKNKSDQPAKKPAVPVTVGEVTRKTVPVQLQTIGTVEAFSTVAVKSQVNGELSRVHFTEGQDVKKGDLLFTIDPRPFEAQIRQAEATLARDIAQMEHAQEVAARYGELVKKGFVAQEQYEQFRTNAASLEAVVRADRAVLENAHLQLKYCYIYAPINGRTGNLLIHQGNIVKANADTPMVIINQIQPIRVNFSLPEKELSRVKKHLSGGKMTVEAKIEGEKDRPEAGQVTFLDNTVDPATATIKLKGTFANNANRLWPGQFVTIVLTLSSLPDAVIVPTQAVQTGQQGQFVFVIKDDTAELRPVTIGISYEEQTVVEKGLEPGEQVVTDGQMRLISGARVDIRKPLDRGPENGSAPPAATPEPGKAGPAQKGGSKP